MTIIGRNYQLCKLRSFDFGVYSSHILDFVGFGLGLLESHRDIFPLNVHTFHFSGRFSYPQKYSDFLVGQAMCCGVKRVRFAR